MKIEMNRASFYRHMAEYCFFDANLWLPDSSDQTFFNGSDLASVLQKDRYFHINQVVVSSVRGYRQGPLPANEDLIKLVADLPDVYVAATLAPEAAFVKGGIEAYLDYLIANKVVLVRLFPHKLNYSLSDWCIGNILASLEQRRLPLMIWHSELDFDILSQLCQRYPGLPVILEGNDKKLLYHNRAYIPLIKKQSNLYLETHNFVQYLGYEFFFQEHLSDRLIFGTYLPINDPGAAVSALLYADIPEDTKNKIASENLVDLLQQIII